MPDQSLSIHAASVLALRVIPWIGCPVAKLHTDWGPPREIRACTGSKRSVHEYLLLVEPVPGTTTPVHVLVWFEVDNDKIVNAWMPLMGGSE